MLKKLTHLLALLGLNSVPAVGWFAGGWSAGTTLALYWVENVVASLFVAARIYLHSRANPCRGHFDYQPPENKTRGAGGTYLSSFLPISLAFSFGHGVFLFGLMFVLTMNGHGAEIALDRGDILRGSVMMIGFLTVNFLVDLPNLRTKPFGWSEAQGGRMLSRVITVHLTVIFGMVAVAFTGATRAFFGVFVGLKALTDLGSISPQWNPKEPPAWLCSLMDKMPNVHPGEKFRDFWTKDRAKEVARRASNEKPWVPKKHRKA